MTLMLVAFLLVVPGTNCLGEEGLVEDGQLLLDAVVEHFEDLYRSDSAIATATLIITKPRRTRTLTMKNWSKGRDRALIVIQSPPREKGTATLKVDKNLWNYLPRIERTIRIPPSMMLASWMGSDFTNDDLVRESSFQDDYVYKLKGRSEDPPGWILSFEAKPDIVGLWQRFELVMSEDGLIPKVARYYDRRGDHACGGKTASRCIQRRRATSSAFVDRLRGDRQARSADPRAALPDRPRSIRLPVSPIERHRAREVPHRHRQLGFRRSHGFRAALHGEADDGRVSLELSATSLPD